MEDDPSVLAGTFKSRRMLEQSEKALSEILAAFDLMAKRIERGDGDVSNAELTKAKVTLGYARTQIVDEVTKHEKRILQSRGLVADAPLDLDELRSSIGSKLDRIREARRAEGVSGEPNAQ